MLRIPNGKLDFNFFPFEAFMKCLYIFMLIIKPKSKNAGVFAKLLSYHHCYLGHRFIEFVLLVRIPMLM